MKLSIDNKFAAEPKVIQSKPQYQGYEINQERNENLMYNKRVIRGNTYARVINPENQNISQYIASDKISTKNKNSQQMQVNNAKVDDHMIYTLEGRVNVEVETDEFVEILTDKPPNYEKECQTDFQMEKPNLRFYLPKKVDNDVETQIWDGDIFDFDYEVQPILNVLCGKTLQIAVLEVLEEEELKTMKKEQEKYESLHKHEIEEIRRLEAKEMDLLKKNQETKKVYQQQLDKNVKSHQLVMSRIISKQFLSKLESQTVEKLDQQGIFQPKIEMQIQNELQNWMIDQVCQIQNQENCDSKYVKELSHNFYSSIVDEHKDTINKRIQFLEDLDIERKRQAQLAYEEKMRKKEEKRRIAEKKRIDAFKDIITEQFFGNQSQKENFYKNSLSDIMGDADKTYVGLFGGVIGEISIFLLSLKKVEQIPDLDAELKQSIEQYFERKFNIDELIDMIFQYISEQQGEIFINVNEGFLEEAQKLDSELLMDTVLFCQDEFKDQILNLLNDFVVLPNFQEEDFEFFGNFSTHKEVVSAAIQLFYKYQKIIKLVEYKQFVPLPKALLQFSPKVNPEQLIKSNFSVPQFLNIENSTPQQIWNYEQEDNYTQIVNVKGDIRIFMVHQIAQIFLRGELIQLIISNKKGFAKFETFLMENLSEQSNEYLKIIVKQWKQNVTQQDQANLFDLIDYDQY